MEPVAPPEGVTAESGRRDGGAAAGDTWPTSRAQRNLEMMYRLTGRMSSEKPGAALEQEPVSADTLEAKDIETGKSLIMYVAEAGEKDWFAHLVNVIKSELGLRGLVKQLKESDANGAPLLFLAASSKGPRSCFEAVRQEIEETLSAIGLIEQVEAVDRKAARGILMYAARSNHLEVFLEVLRLLEAACKGTLSGQNLHKDWKKKLETAFIRPDKYGRTLLHHASEAGNADILRTVVEMAEEYKVLKAMSKPDNNGRTPMMYVLRRRYSAGSIGDSVAQKFELLWEKRSDAGDDGWMHSRLLRLHPETPRELRGLPADYVSSASTKKEKAKLELNQVVVKGKTELMHAAYGGLQSWYLVVRKIVHGGGELDLDEVDLDGILALTLEKKKKVANERLEPIPELSDDVIKSWGHGMLLAAAARRGHVDVLDLVERKIRAHTRECEDQLRVRRAIEAVSLSGRSLFTLAILSRSTKAVDWVHAAVERNFKGEAKRWEIFSGQRSNISSLSCAVSALVTDNQEGTEMFDKVLGILEQVYDGWCGRQKVMTALRPPPTITGSTSLTPLTAAVFSGNWYTFKCVYDRCAPWTREQFLNQVPKVLMKKSEMLANEHQDMHEEGVHIERSVAVGEAGIPSVMWPYVVKGFRHCKSLVRGGTSEHGDISWKEHFKEHSRRAVETAHTRGSYDGIRGLVQDGFPLHATHTALLLHDIGDHEEDVIDTVMLTIRNATNPFVAAASVNTQLREIESRHPMYAQGLQRLRNRVNSFVMKVLHNLPHTVHGMGRAVLGSHLSFSQDDDYEHLPLGNLAGYMVVEWMLEPLPHIDARASLLELQGDLMGSQHPEWIDPLQNALDQGSLALDFINSRLVLDFIHVKFTATLPGLTTRNPFSRAINEGLYRFDDIRGGGGDDGNTADRKNKRSKEKAVSWAFLLRFLQGWTWECGMLHDNKIELLRWTFPHHAILPGLQFSLAGLIGKPDVFFEIPVIRFLFDFLSYMVMLALFYSIVKLEDSAEIPRTEWIFYVFVWGLLWREILEFRDGVPRRRLPRDTTRVQLRNDEKSSVNLRDHKTKAPGPASDSQVDAMEAIARYAKYDQWNVVDTMTIAVLIAAFVFRILGQREARWTARTNEDGDWFLAAQVLLAISGPLLFARVLVLSQVDTTVGPMTQIIWRMVFQLCRYAVFIIIVMGSFALAFYAIFFNCPTPEEEIEENPLQEAFGTVGSSLISMFEAGLGGFDFGVFDFVTEYCRRPPWVRHAGISLMVVYLIIMAILLMNLLIAVLSTAHADVNKEKIKHFNLARTRLIQQSARAVAYRRVPPPLNLVMVAVGILFDLFGEVRQILHRCCPCWPSVQRSAQSVKPITATYRYRTVGGGLQRICFAGTMGIVAVMISSILWVISIPWVGWNILCWIQKPTTKKGARRAIDNVYRMVEKKASGTCGRGDPKTGNGAKANPTDDHHTSSRGMDNGIRDENSGGMEIEATGEMDPDDVLMDHEWRGFLRTFCLVIAAFIAWLACTALAMLFCALCVVGSALLWFRGLWSVREWVRWRLSRDGKKFDECPVIMPGEGRRNRWIHAWEIAKSKNLRTWEDPDSPHFNVAPLLKSSTGLDLTMLLDKLHKEMETSKNDETMDDLDLPGSWGSNSSVRSFRDKEGGKRPTASSDISRSGGDDETPASMPLIAAERAHTDQPSQAPVHLARRRLSFVPEGISIGSMRVRSAIPSDQKSVSRDEEKKDVGGGVN